MLKTFKVLLAAMTVFAVTALSALSAFAADTAATAVTYQIQVAPTVHQIVTVVFGAVSAIGSYYFSRLVNAKKDFLTKLNIDASQQAMLDSSIADAIGFAENALNTYADQIPSIKVKNEMVATAANYVLEDIPAVLAHFGIDKTWLISLLTARLTQKAGAASAVVASAGTVLTNAAVAPVASTAAAG